MNGLYGGLLQQCKERYQSGQRRPCLADKIIAEQDQLGLKDHQIAFLLGVMLEGGSDTVSRANEQFPAGALFKDEPG
jgi:hypothetical protein